MAGTDIVGESEIPLADESHGNDHRRLLSLSSSESLSINSEVDDNEEEGEDGTMLLKDSLSRGSPGSTHSGGYLGRKRGLRSSLTGASMRESFHSMKKKLDGITLTPQRSKKGHVQMTDDDVSMNSSLNSQAENFADDSDVESDDDGFAHEDDVGQPFRKLFAAPPQRRGSLANSVDSAAFAKELGCSQFEPSLEHSLKSNEVDLADLSVSNRSGLTTATGTTRSTTNSLHTPSIKRSLLLEAALGQIGGNTEKDHPLDARSAHSEPSPRSQEADQAAKARRRPRPGSKKTKDGSDTPTSTVKKKVGKKPKKAMSEASATKDSSKRGKLKKSLSSSSRARAKKEGSFLKPKKPDSVAAAEDATGGSPKPKKKKKIKPEEDVDDNASTKSGKKKKKKVKKKDDVDDNASTKSGKKGKKKRASAAASSNMQKANSKSSVATTEN